MATRHMFNCYFRVHFATGGSQNELKEDLVECHQLFTVQTQIKMIINKIEFDCSK